MENSEFIQSLVVVVTHVITFIVGILFRKGAK